MAQQSYSDYMREQEEQQPTRLQRVADKLRSIGHKMSLIPVVNLLSFLGVPAIFTGVAAGLDTVSELTKGRLWGGVKQAVSGGVDTAATFAMGWAETFTLGAPVWWASSVFTSIGTGDSLQEVLRTGTKSMLDSIDGTSAKNANKLDPLTEYARTHQVLGMEPQMTGAMTAGVGYAPWVPQQQMMVPAALAPSGYPGQNMPPNYWTNTIAQQEGVDPRVRQARWMSAAENRDNYQQLMAARREAELQAPVQRG